MFRVYFLANGNGRQSENKYNSFQVDVAEAAKELSRFYNNNDDKRQAIDRIGENLAKYALNEYRYNKEWKNKVLLSMFNDHSWILEHITHESKALHFNVYGYIVHTYFNGTECDAGKCASLKNAERDRLSIFNSSTTDILDVIHIALLHGYDTGERLYPNERNKLGDIKEENTSVYDDLEVELIRTMVGDRIERHQKRKRQNKRLSKYLSELVDVRTSMKDTNDYKNDNNENENESKNVMNKNVPENPKLENTGNIKYSFGYKFYYHQKFENNLNIDKYYNGGTNTYGYWYIPKKYESVKEELLKANEATIIVKSYDIEMKSGELYVDSQFIRKLLPREDQCEDYDGIDCHSTLQAQHLMCLLFYCNDMGNFCHFFCATFRKSSDSESDEDLKLRNGKLREYSRLLVECVHCYGTVMQNSNIDFFYRGITSEMAFLSPLGQFCSPTSTTTALPVAIHFGKKGIVLELANNRSEFMSFFDCGLFSCFTNESELLFIQGGFNSNHSELAHSAMAFKSVRYLNLKSEKNYETFAIASCLQQMIKGKNAINNTIELKSMPTSTDCLLKLIGGNETFDSMIGKTENICICTDYMNKHEHGKNFYFIKLRDFFCELYTEEEIDKNKKVWGRKFRQKARDGHEKGFVQPIFSFKFDVFFDLFPNLINIEIFHLPITHRLMKDILQLKIWNNEYRRNDVRIFIKEENEIYKTQSDFKSYDDCIVEYGDVYAEKRLKISKFVGDANDGIEISVNVIKDETCDASVAILQDAKEVDSNPADNGKEAQSILRSQEEYVPKSKGGC